MRSCVKPRCDRIAEASVGVRYADRLVVIGGLGASPDPNLLEICANHVASLTPPYGWTVLDERRPVSALDVGLSA